MKIALQKNLLGGQIWYKSLDTSKKRRDEDFFKKIFSTLKRAITN